MGPHYYVIAAWLSSFTHQAKGLYYRLLTGSGPLSDTYVKGLFSHVIEGLGGAEPRTPVSRAVEITQRKRSR
jgi:hypothetical protein